ncbi:HEPN domain-containing protein [Dolichospermum circinale CS-1225]|uniref:HEPN domain-containing protein n=1 Tax=Dolichospermum circinale TaxID=109265 RepID=UPI000426ED69|nr:HEPN domain-containing protein [Dolichospermum circinale]MDB9521989.1 HEPN domain-containing protein [Dolichospermum circinale CS-1225]
MINQQLKLLIEYRLSESEETLREAKILLNQSAFRGTINRYYYAMFYAALGLLATKGLGSSKHSGIVSFFDREFVKTGIFSKDLSRSFHRAFDERQASDYGEMLEADMGSAMALFERAQNFVDEITQYLKSWMEVN